MTLVTRADPTSDESARGREAIRWAVGLILVLTAVRLLYLVALPPPLFGDEAQYWSWSLDPAWGYFSKPPMVAWVIWLTTSVFGSSEVAIKLAAPLVHAITAGFLLLAGRRLVGPVVGAVAGAVYVTMPAASLSAVIISTDPVMLMFLSAALYGLIRALEEGAGPGWWLASGVATGGALLSKYSAAVFLVSAVAALLLSPEHRRRVTATRLAAWLVPVALLLAPNLWWNAQHDFVTMRHVGENASVTGFALHVDRMVEFLASQFGVFGPISFGALIALLVRWRRWTSDPRLLLLVWLTAPMLVIMTVQALLAKANANWAAMAYVGGTVAVASVLARPANRRWLWAGLAVNLGLAAMLYGYEPVRLVTGFEPPDRRDPLRHVRGWPEYGEQFAALWAEHPGTAVLFDDRLILAESLYYAGVPLESAFNWNPEGVIHHHYDLVSDLDSWRGRDVLFVHRSPDCGEVAAYFRTARPLGRIAIPTHPDRTLELWVTRLDGFAGYHERGPGGGGLQ